MADALMVIPLPVEEQCRGVLSEPLPNLQLLTGRRLGHSCDSPQSSRWRVVLINAQLGRKQFKLLDGVVTAL